MYLFWIYQLTPVASLPMRNWNLDGEYYYEFDIMGLRAYLWGIETSWEEQTKRNISLGCEPTYEELKR